MKTKKIFILLASLVLMLSLTACNRGKDTVNFDYTDPEILSSGVSYVYSFLNMSEADKIVINNTEGKEVYQAAIENFEAAENECGEFQGFITTGNEVLDIPLLLEAIQQSEDSYNMAINMIDYEIEEDGSDVILTMNLKYKERSAKANFVFCADLAQTQSMQDENGQVVGVTTPFKPKEITVTPDYSFSEKMAKAGANTLMGMGTVFIVLIFISIIIAQFQRIDKIVTAISNAVSKFLANRKAKKAEKKLKKAAAQEEAAQSAPASTGGAVVANPAQGSSAADGELIAVITAAVVAANVAAGGTDKLVVRSIKKAKR